MWNFVAFKFVETFIRTKGSKFIILVIRNLQQGISQYALDEFFSFLNRWISLIKSYNSDIFIVYYIIILKYVFENFNCILFDNWILNGIRAMIPRNLERIFSTFSQCLQLCISITQYAMNEFFSFLQRWKAWN